MTGCTFCLAAPAQAQERATYVRGFLQGHVESVSTTVNGLEQSYDLIEPSVGLSLLGSILSPRFFTYEAGVGFLRSDLSGDEIDLKTKDINYFLFGTFFPGRRFSIDLQARQFTDELKDNLFLFNRSRYRELGGKILLYEGDRLPQMSLEYFRRERQTTTAVETFNEEGSDLNAYIDKRTGEYTYHLGFIRSAYESKDYGTKVSTNIITIDATKMLTPNLEGEIRGELLRSTTETSRFDAPNLFVVETDEELRGVPVLAPLKRQETEINLGASLRYRTPRLDADADLDYTRATAGRFKNTQELGQLRAIYRPSNRITWSGNYSLLLADTNGLGSSDQTLSVRWTRVSRPTLVFYVQGQGEMARSDPGVTTVAATSGFRNFTLFDLDGGVDYTRPIGRFTMLSNLVLGAGYATVNPGENGLRSLVEARLGISGRVFRRATLNASLVYRDRNDGSSYSFDTNNAHAQVLLTMPIRRRFQLRARAFASRFKQEGSTRTAGPLIGQQVVNLDINQRTAELGLNFFLIRNTYGYVSVGRTSQISKQTMSEDLENRYNYMDFSLSSYPIRNLQLNALARIRRGFELNDITDDDDSLELTAIYRLRDWEFLVGYSTNHIILGTTDIEQKRTYFTVRRNFFWRVR